MPISAIALALRERDPTAKATTSERRPVEPIEPRPSDPLRFCHHRAHQSSFRLFQGKREAADRSSALSARNQITPSASPHHPNGMNEVYVTRRRGRHADGGGRARPAARHHQRPRGPGSGELVGEEGVPSLTSLVSPWIARFIRRSARSPSLFSWPGIEICCGRPPCAFTNSADRTNRPPEPQRPSPFRTRSRPRWQLPRRRGAPGPGAVGLPRAGVLGHARPFSGRGVRSHGCDTAARVECEHRPMRLKRAHAGHAWCLA